MRSSLVVGSALVLAAVTVTAQAPVAAVHDTVAGYRLRLLGVYDAETGEALAGVNVTNAQTGIGVPTNASGLVRLLFLPDGGGLVQIRKLGYTGVTRFVAISPADTAPVTELLMKVQTLPTVTTRDSTPKHISGALNGFEERLASGSGRFISGAELRKHEDEKLGDVLRILPGAMLVQRGGGAMYFVSSRKMCDGPVFLSSASCSRGSPDCYATIYLDGVPYYQPEAITISGGRPQPPVVPPPDVNKIVPVSELAGVEYYASDMVLPAGFTSGRNGCGTVLLWTRER